MRMPSPPYGRLDFVPPSADQFIFGVAPLDYGPVLLRKPFGFRLTADTLPSGNCKRWLQVRLGCVRLSSSCPFRLLHTFLSPGQRGITPAFGYGAPQRTICLVHPPGSANRTSVSAPALLEFGQVMLDPSQNRGVRQPDPSIGHHDY